MIVHYLRLAFVPWPLALDYEWPATRSVIDVLPQAALLVALGGLTVWGLARHKPVAFLGAWFFVILAPSSSVLPIITEVAAEHRMYLPLAAVIVLLVVGAYAVVRRAADVGEAGSGEAASSATRLVPFRVVGWVIVAVAVGGCVSLTRQRNVDYQSNEGIWTDTVAKRPDNSRALANLGTILIEQGRAAEAEPYLRRAVGIRPDYPEAQSGLGVALCTLGKLEEGIAHFERAIALVPDYRDAHRNLGEAFGALGRNGDAARAFRAALVSAPDDTMLLVRLAWLLATSPEDDVRDGADALGLARRAVEVAGSDVAALDALAAAYAETGQFADAVTVIDRAVAVGQTRGPTELVPELQQRAALYRAGQAFRQPKPQGR